MIKRLTAWHVRSDVERDEALRYWRVDHAPLVKQVPGVVRYVQNHCVPGPAGAQAPPYDGMGELCFESAEAAEAALGTPEWNAVIEDAATFMDLGRVTAAWAEEHVV